MAWRRVHSSGCPKPFIFTVHVHVNKGCSPRCGRSWWSLTTSLPLPTLRLHMTFPLSLTQQKRSESVTNTALAAADVCNHARPGDDDRDDDVMLSLALPSSYKPLYATPRQDFTSLLPTADGRSWMKRGVYHSSFGRAARHCTRASTRPSLAARHCARFEPRVHSRTPALGST